MVLLCMRLPIWKQCNANSGMSRFVLVMIAMPLKCLRITKYNTNI